MEKESKKIVMIVDDDKDDRFLFQTAMKAVVPENICLVSEGGKEALQLLSDTDNLPDVIFLDINMPGMSGWEFLTKIKHEERLKNIPVLMYSTSAHDRDVIMAHDFGAVGYCVKPDDFDGLQTIIEFVIAAINTGNLAEAIKTNTTLKYLKHTTFTPAI